MPTETIDAAVDRLHAAGFTDSCRSEEEGIRFTYGNATFAPEELSTHEVVRLEGTSAPDESTVIFGLSSPGGEFKGTYCVSFGPEMDPLDADCLQRLESEVEPSRRQEQREGLQPQF